MFFIITDIVNNVSYNTAGAFSHVDLGKQKVIVPINYVGNTFKVGPNSKSGIYGVKIENDGPLGARIYVSGNISPRRILDTQPQIDFVDPNARSYVVDSPNTPNSLNDITMTSAQDAYNAVLEKAGNSYGLDCGGNWVNRRDSIDTRIVNEVETGTGKIIDDPSQVGGYATIASGTACLDSDSDGMPDVFESSQSFDPNSNDINGDKDGDGYTNLEEYLNGNDIFVPVLKQGDADEDGDVDIFDYNLLVTDFGGSNSRSDFNRNGIVDLDDFSVFLVNFGK